MIQAGESAHDVVMEGSNGQTLRLSDFLGKKVVLYFYPKDLTSGCTTEATDFRDRHADFEQNELL